MYKWTFILVLTSYSLCNGYKLLLVFPFPSVSHSVLAEGYVRNLLRAGHEITYITPYTIKNVTKGLRQIEVINNTKLYPEASNINNIIDKKIDMESIGSVLDIMFEITKSTVMHVNVQKLINDPKEQFDAVIVEWMYSEVYAGFSSVFNCPLIWSSPLEPHPLTLTLLNEDLYKTNLLVSNSNDFWQRLKDQFQWVHIKFHKWLRRGKEESLFNRAFGPAIAKRGGILPSFEAVKYNGSLLLGNSHFSTGQTFHLPQNYIQIAGYHIGENRQPLPTDLQNIMDGAKQGVIYFDMGPMLRTNTLPDTIKADILDVFKKINKTVVWKYEGKLKTSKNVYIFDKLPQQSILAHPNCALFITTGELLSIIESVHFGIPMIGIPVFGQQFNNIHKAETNGYAQGVKFMDAKALKKAIDNVLSNPRYREKAKELSSIFRDRPISPDKELIFWIEYVIRGKGEFYLSYPVVFPWYYVIYLEFIIVFVITVACVYIIFVYLLRRCKKDKDLSLKKYI